MNLKDIQKELDKVMNEYNNRSIPVFEGFSPSEMHHILYFPFEPNSPISIQKLADPEYLEIPLLNQVKYLLDLIEDAGEIKLTAKGFLPTKFVKEIYNQHFFGEPEASPYQYKIYKEQDAMTVNLTRLLAELAGLTKKRHGKLSMTSNGKRISSNNSMLFEAIFKTMATKFNWAYYDLYEDNQIGQFAFGFTLALLSKYGNVKRFDDFYAEKYFSAFPKLKEHESLTKYGDVEWSANSCYSIRTFDRFLDYFGLIQIEKIGETWKKDMHITKTALFDKIIKVELQST